VALVGFIGDQGWDAFTASKEWSEGGTDVLDRWTHRVLKSVAEDVGALPLFPFDGPPWWPFQKWALKAEALFPSPIGILIHPEWGLWHSWRGALAFQEPLEAPVATAGVSPCEGCDAKPCLTACPAYAITAAGYDATKCLGFLDAIEDESCMAVGCMARHACPVGIEYRYRSERVIFHMNSFRRGQWRSKV
jgi:ferredoxin